MQADYDEMANEAHISEDKSKKAMVDAARLADELRNEQELAQDFEKCRKLLECQLKDMQGRLDEAETNALKVFSLINFLKAFIIIMIFIKGWKEGHEQDGHKDQGTRI